MKRYIFTSIVLGLLSMSLNAQKESDRKQQYTLMSLNFRKSNKSIIIKPTQFY